MATKQEMVYAKADSDRNHIPTAIRHGDWWSYYANFRYYRHPSQYREWQYEDSTLYTV